MKYLGRLLMVLVVMIIMASSSVAQAAGPYLVCDPYPASSAVTSFILFWDGATTGVSVPVTTDATGTYLHYDLAAISAGIHTVKARAKNSWGESADSAPFAFTKSVPTVPVNVKINVN